MIGFFVTETRKLIEAIGEEQVNLLISDFSCPVNTDVENFLHNNAILSEKQGFSVTRLVFASYKKEPVLVGYYTLANKVIVISKSCRISKTLKKRLNRFGTYNQDLQQREIPAPLIAQLAKNYQYKSQNLISGDDLLELATESVRQSLRLLGGRVVYLECEKDQRLIDFYVRNGFRVFDERTMDSEERSLMKGTALVQLIKYFDLNDLQEKEKNENIPADFAGKLL